MHSWWVKATIFSGILKECLHLAFRNINHQQSTLTLLFRALHTPSIVHVGHNNAMAHCTAMIITTFKTQRILVQKSFGRRRTFLHFRFANCVMCSHISTMLYLAVLRFKLVMCRLCNWARTPYKSLYQQEIQELFQSHECSNATRKTKLLAWVLWMVWCTHSTGVKRLLQNNKSVISLFHSNEASPILSWIWAGIRIIAGQQHNRHEGRVIFSMFISDWLTYSWCVWQSEKSTKPITLVTIAVIKFKPI